VNDGAPDGWTPELAESFDALTERWLGAYGEHACALASVHPGEQALDVGAGTGRLALALGAQLGGSGKVLGVDVAESMLAVARRRGRKLGLTPHVVRFQVGEAGALPVADASVDVATALFVLGHLGDPARAVSELARVLRPKGRVVVGLGARPGAASVSAGRYLLRRVRDRARAAAGRSVDVPALLHELLGAPDGKDLLGDDPAGRVKGLLTSAGFREVRTSWVGDVADLPDPASAWEVSRTLSSSARLRLHATDAEAVTQIRREFEARCRRVQGRGGRLVFPHGAALLRARLA